MNREKLYNKTTNILFDAYFQNKLLHGVCHACVVGNLCGGKNDWARVFSTRTNHILTAGGESIPVGTFTQHFDPSAYVGYVKDMIDNTGYELAELMAIERAFERAYKGENEEDYMFNGLVAVLDTLKKIHKVEDDEEIKEKFRSHSVVRKALCTA